MYTTETKTKGLTQANKHNPCVHCGKPDWCYSLQPSGITVCKRDNIATGWIKTGGRDQEGHFYSIPESKAAREKEKPTVIDTQEWIYYSRDG
ncbi:hypothetical protein C7H19_25200, partial [Aphanothece hegewaldii CCALA 016]